MAKARAAESTSPEPVMADHRSLAANALRSFATEAGQKPTTSRDAAANFFVGLIQLSEQEGFIIDDALRTARIRIFNANSKRR